MPIEKLEAWADDCRERHASLLNGPAPALRRVFEEVLTAVSDLISAASSPMEEIQRQHNEASELGEKLRV